jgi:dihydrolipoamide dehydrogenase
VKNFIIVNEKMEASIPGIYAVGDITGKILLAHVASAQGKVAAEAACGKDISMDYASVPRCIYTLPEVSAVGLTEEKAKEQGLKYKVGKFPFQALGKAQAIGEKEGFVKVIDEEGTDKLLGVHIIGPQATNLIQEAVEVIKLGGRSSDIAWAIHAHPTLSEAVMEAAENIFGKAIHILNK